VLHLFSVESRRVAIVGAGPIGIELAVALKQAGVSYIHFDAKQIGQTMYWWPPATRWFSSNERIAIAGVPLTTNDQSKATREDYLRYLRSVVQQFDLKINTYEPVSGIEKTPGGFVVKTAPAAGPREYLAENVVLATGGTAAPRRLNVSGEDLPHVSHYMEDPHKYFGKRVLIVGRRNSAVEAALRCHHVGADVTISYRRSQFDGKSIKYWLTPEINGLMKVGKVKAQFNTVVSAIDAGGARLLSCRDDELFGPTGESAIDVEADFVLLLIGYVADMSLARKAGVKLMGENEIPQFNPATMETNIPGLYVAGTAIGGTQARYRIFLENCHSHVDRILASLMGAAPPAESQPNLAPET
jgi:thioredoxin reductase (NADPH)